MQRQVVPSTSQDSFPSSFFSFESDFDNLHSNYSHFDKSALDNQVQRHCQMNLLEPTRDAHPDTSCKNKIAHPDEVIKMFPTNPRFDDQPVRPILSTLPESTSTVPSCAASSYTSSSASSLNWFTEGLLNADILHPTVPDLTLSFVESTSWKPLADQKSANPSGRTSVVGHQHDQIHNWTASDYKQPSIGTSLESVLPSGSIGEEPDADQVSSIPTTPISSPIPKQRTASHSSPIRGHVRKSPARPVSQIVGNSSSTVNGKVKSRKSLAFTLGSNRLRNSICLESQLEDVMATQTNTPVVEHPKEQENNLHTDTQKSRVQRTRRRLSSFLPFSPAGVSDSHTDAKNKVTDDCSPRRSFNLLDRTHVSFSSSSVVTFNTSTSIPLRKSTQDFSPPASSLGIYSSPPKPTNTKLGKPKARRQNVQAPQMRQSKSLLDFLSLKFSK